MVLAGLGIEQGAFEDFMKTKPSYPQLEAWILEQKGGSLDKGAVDKLNDDIEGYNHDDATRGAILAASNIADDGSILDAVNLNNLEDWQEFHAQEIA